MAKKAKIPAGYFDRAAMALVLDVSVQQFDRTYRPLMSENDVKAIDGRPYFRARGLIDVLIEREKGQKTGDVDDMLLTSGSDSPNLERLRAARASIAELELEERRKTHVDVRQLDNALMRFAGIIRRGSEVLQRRHGNEATDILNEAVDEAKRQWRDGADAA